MQPTRLQMPDSLFPLWPCSKWQEWAAKMNKKSCVSKERGLMQKIELCTWLPHQPETTVYNLPNLKVHSNRPELFPPHKTVWYVSLHSHSHVHPHVHQSAWKPILDGQIACPTARPPARSPASQVQCSDKVRCSRAGLTL
jgi:hypothetical protein